jgi:hypothetical protein
VRGRVERQRVQDWSTALASVLDEVAVDVGTVARRLADSWPDAQGEDWAERLHRVRHVLQREVDAALELGRAADRAPDDSDETGPAQPGWTGPRLGGTAGRRVDDTRGVRIPRLNDPADDAS